MQNKQALMQDRNSKTISGVGNKFITGQLTLASTTIPALLLPANTRTLKVILKAMTGNQGNIYVGDINVDTESYYLDADQTVELQVDNDKVPIYVLPETADDKINYIAWYAE